MQNKIEDKKSEGKSICQQDPSTQCKEETRDRNLHIGFEEEKILLYRQHENASPEESKSEVAALILDHFHIHFFSRSKFFRLL